MYSSFFGILELYDVNLVIMLFLCVFMVKVNSYFIWGFVLIWYVIKNLYIMINFVNNLLVYSYYMKFKDF